MDVKEKYLKYCSDLFDFSVALQKAKERVGKNVLTKEELSDAKKDMEQAEEQFLVCCQNIKDEYDATNPKTPEAKGLLEFMNAIHQGHYSTI